MSKYRFLTMLTSILTVFFTYLATFDLQALTHDPYDLHFIKINFNQSEDIVHQKIVFKVY